MEIVALIIGLIVLILAASKMRADAIGAEIDRQKRKDAEAALDTKQRIDDATADPLPADPARSWLRRFGGGATARKR